MFSLGRLCKADAISARIPGSISCPLPINQLDRNANNLLCGSTLWRLLVFSLDLADEKTLKVSIILIDLLHLHKHRCLHIRQANDDGLHLTASNRSSFSAIASLQNAETFRHLLLFRSSSAWWSCWASPSG